MLILTLILACEPETVRQGSPEDVDLSGYATLEDLAALQAELDELRSGLIQVEEGVGCDSTDGGTLLGYVNFDREVHVISVAICQDTTGSPVCFASVYSSSATVIMGGYSARQDPGDQNGDGALTTVVAWCEQATDIVAVTYLPAQG